VICFEDFMTAAQPYVDWKNQKGIHTVMVSHTTVGNTHQQIRSFISDYYDENPELAFVQIIGDHAQVPTIIHNAGSSGLGTGGSDPSYAILRGANNFPDIYIGRFSAENITQVETQVYRTIHYERDIDRTATWLSMGSGIASNEGFGIGHNGGEADNVHMENIRQFLLSYNYDLVDQFYQSPRFDTPPPHTGPVSVTQIQSALNNGRSIVNYVGHGTGTAWSFAGTNSMSFTNSHINQLTNDYKLPHIFSVACDNGKFHDRTCFGEAWLRATNTTTGAPTGAIAAYMSSILQPWLEPMTAQDFMIDYLVNDSYNTIGSLYYNAAIDMLSIYNNTNANHTLRTWNIFGDASLMIRSRTPVPMVVEASDIVFKAMSTTYPVRTNAVNALVSLYDPIEKRIIAADYTNFQGNVTLDVSNKLLDTSELLLTITAKNYETFIMNVESVNHDDAFLIYQAAIFKDESLPNNDTTVDLNISIKNIGLTDANNVVLTLSTKDNFVTITNNKVSISTIPALTSVTTSTDFFSFDIDIMAPNNHVVSFVLDMTNDEDDLQTETFNITINAPALDFISNVFFTCLDDSEKNYLELGETATLMLPIDNIGRNVSSTGNVRLFSNLPGITIKNNNFEIGAIEPGDVNYASFEITACMDIDPGTLVNLSFLATFDTQTIHASFTIPVGLSVEGFETGDFSAFNWTNVGATPWKIDSIEAFEGTYSARSGVINHGQTTTLSITKTLIVDGTISFWYKVSSEAGFDRLQFLINNQLQDEYSGEIDWTFATFPVSAGTNQFAWRYRKNNTISVGEDSAWIDNITFPIPGRANFTEALISIDADSFDFSEAKVGGVYVEEFTIQNNGNASLIYEIALPEGFSISVKDSDVKPDIRSALTPLASRTYLLTFSPTTEMDYSGFINIKSNDYNVPNQNIHLIADLIIVSDTDKVVTLTTYIYGNFPNPFNPSTTFRFSVAQRQNVEISVYNVRGQLVKSVTNQMFDVGNHSVVWDGTDSVNRSVSSGIYFYKFNTSDKVQINKMLLLK
jgi:hypothetical protein